MRNNAGVIDYATADAFLGKRDRRKLAASTYVLRLDAQRIGVKYHETIIVEYSRKGYVALYSGGWHTMSTKERIGKLTPDSVRIWAHIGKWYVGTGCGDYWGDQTRTVDFTEGMRIYPDSGLVSAKSGQRYRRAPDADVERDEREYRKGRRHNGRRRVPAGAVDRVWQREPYGRGVRYASERDRQNSISVADRERMSPGPSSSRYVPDWAPNLRLIKGEG